MSSLIVDEGAGAGEVEGPFAPSFFFFRLRLFFFGQEGVELSASSSESLASEIS
jgi:hypothetical protein